MSTPPPPPIDPGTGDPGPRQSAMTSGEKASTATSFDGSVRPDLQPSASGSSSSASAAASAPPGAKSAPSTSGDATPAPTATGDATSADAKTDAKSTKGGRHVQSAEYQRQKEIKRKAFELRCDKIRLALWPNPVAVQTMEKSVGGPIDYERLVNSTRFMDAWCTFDKKKVPSGNDRDFVKKVAKDTLAKRPSRSRRGSKDKSDEQASKESKKRARDPSASSTASSKNDGATPKVSQLPKIPKVTAGKKKDEPAPPSKPEMMDVSSAAATPPMGEPTKPEKPEEKSLPDTGSESSATQHRDNSVLDASMEEPVEDDSAEPDLATFVKDMDSNLPAPAEGSYAGAAKGKSRTNMPFILYVHTGTDVRGPITKAQWTIFLEKFNVALFDLAIEGGETPIIDWSGHSKGTGLIAAMDSKSQDIVVELVSKIEVADVKFKAWPKGAKVENTFVTIKLPASLSAVPANRAVDGISRMNGLVGCGWYLYRCRDLPKSKERILQMVVTASCLDTLRKKGGQLQAGANRVEVFYKRVRLH